MNVGCAPSPTTGYFPYAYGGYTAAPYAAGYPTAALAGPFGGWDIVGADPVPAPAPASPNMWDKTKTFLGEKSLGLQNGYWLGGAAALAAIWFAYNEGFFGRK